MLAPLCGVRCRTGCERNRNDGLWTAALQAKADAAAVGQAMRKRPYSDSKAAARWIGSPLHQRFRLGQGQFSPQTKWPKSQSKLFPRRSELLLKESEVHMSIRSSV